MFNRLNALLFRSAMAAAPLAGCDIGKSEAEQCLADAEGETSAAVMNALEADFDCISFSMEVELEDGNGIACIAAENGSYWTLDLVEAQDNFFEFCGLNGASQVECVEVSDSDEDDEVACESVITLNWLRAR